MNLSDAAHAEDTSAQHGREVKRKAASAAKADRDRTIMAGLKPGPPKSGYKCRAGKSGDMHLEGVTALGSTDHATNDEVVGGPGFSPAVTIWHELGFSP